MKLSREEINILIMLIDDKLEEAYDRLDEVRLYWKPEILQNLSRKLEQLND